MRTSPQSPAAPCTTALCNRERVALGRDGQLGEYAHRYAEGHYECNGVQALALLRTLGLNLLRINGFRSIRTGLMAVVHDINRMLGWSRIQALERD